MTFQEIVDSVKELSWREQDKLIELIYQQREKKQGDIFWNELQKFRATLKQENIEFNNDDFSNLRDRATGREVNL